MIVPTFVVYSKDWPIEAEHRDRKVCLLSMRAARVKKDCSMA